MDPDPADVSLFEVVVVLLRHRRVVLTTTVLAVVLAAVVVLSSSRSYTATATFMPQSAQPGQPSLAGLAGQLGITVPGNQGGGSPQFYADLLMSREILRAVASDPFSFWAPDAEGDSMRVQASLADLLEIEGRNDELRVRSAVGWLSEEAISVSVSRETGVLDLAVTTPYAGLSAEIARRLLELVNDFNLETRQSQAAQERRFIEGRLLEARDSLRVAEERLKAFLQANRTFSDAPELLFEHDRLERDVAMRHELYTSLSQAYEEARISEVRNTPVITVVEPPEKPAGPASRGLLLKVALGLVLGGLGGSFLAFTREYVQRNRARRTEAYLEFDDVLEETLTGLRGSIGRLRFWNRGG